MAKTPNSDLKAKLDLERTLSASMRGLFKRLARELGMALAKGHPVPDLTMIAQPNVEARLQDHFRRCERKFGTNLQDQFPEEIRPGKVEREFIQIEILRILDNRAEQQSKLIARTTANLAVKAWRRAVLLRTENADELTERDLPQLTANLFATSTLVQAGAVATTETQMGVETCKGVESMLLVGDSVRDVKRGPGIITGTKVWRSQGDSRVRTTENGSKFDHLEADGQRVGSGKAFVVGGERLMWPGDISMGASAGNIIRCRCSAIYEPSSFERLRRAFIKRLFEDVLKPFRQTESENVVGTQLGL